MFFVTRLTGWLLLKVLGFFLMGVQVHEGQMEMVRQAVDVRIGIRVRFRISLI